MEEHVEDCRDDITGVDNLFLRRFALRERFRLFECCVEVAVVAGGQWEWSVKAGPWTAWAGAADVIMSVNGSLKTPINFNGGFLATTVDNNSNNNNKQ